MAQSACQLLNRWLLEERPQRQRLGMAELLLNCRKKADCQERMTADIKEVVLYADWHAQHLLPKLAQFLFDGVTRRHKCALILILIRAELRSWQRPTVDLAIWGQPGSRPVEGR